MSNNVVNPKVLFRTLCKKNLLQVSDNQLDLLGRYSLILLSWNKKINLISRKDENNFWQRHIIGSVSFLFKFQLQSESTMLDIGTGGGLPGIPLAILHPTIKFTLIDSIQKKIHAVNDIVTQLKLDNVSVDCGRAEELAKKSDYAQKFDYVISRAVAPIKDLVKWCKPFLRSAERVAGIDQTQENGKLNIPRGSMLMLKGGNLAMETEAAMVKFKPNNLVTVALPSMDIEDLIDKKIVIVQL